MLKRAISLGLTLGSSLFCAGNAHAVSFEDVETTYLGTAHFQRFMEFFTGIEIVGNKLVLRTDDTDRNGYYWMCDLDKELTALPKGSKIHLSVFIHGNKEMQEFSLSVRGEAEKDLETDTLYLGLTGKDWPSEDISPVAWKIQIESPDGTVLARQKSFAWEMPK